MAWYPDLAPCDYFGDEYAADLRAVGWLQRGHSFDIGDTPESVLRRIIELLEHPWSPSVSCGLHECDLCRFYPEARGQVNLFIPGDGMLYVCPELVVHYMNAHGYAPPLEFCEAVRACPDMGTTEYRKAILANGARSIIRGLARE